MQTMSAKAATIPQRRLALALAMLVAMAGCSWDAPLTGENRPPAAGTASGDAADSLGLHAASIAVGQVGVPYRYGGSSPGGFDCSGLVHYAYARAGKRVPRTTAALYRGSDPVVRADLEAGDLLFFRIDGKLSHVGLYLGDDRFVHAPQSGRVVSVESLHAPFYRRALIGAGRPR